MAKTSLARTLVIKRYERLKAELRTRIDKNGSNPYVRCQVWRASVIGGLVSS